MARSTDVDLAESLTKPNFTAGQKHIPALVDLTAAGNDRAAVALATLGGTARGALQARLESSPDEAIGARLVAALGLLARAGNADAQLLLLQRIADPAVRVRKAAISALGKLGGEVARDAVIARWDATDVPPDERRVLAEALGKLGGELAMARLQRIETGEDRELSRRRDRALLMADRSSKRDAESSIATDVAPASPLTVVLRCRAGFGPLLVEELTALGMKPQGISDAAAEVTLTGPWSTLFASRLWGAAAIRLPRVQATEATPRTRAGIRERSDRVANPEQLARRIVDTILAPPTRALLTAWTRGPIRWRLGFSRGHKRAIVWNVATAVTAAAPELINDPQQTTWEFLVDDQSLTIDLSPKRFDDPRWAWRVAEVPAASHPSVAAALVQLAEVCAGEQVWDPFCGSGLEVIEAAKRGAVASGTDLDEEALAAAAQNIAAAGVTAKLARSDARVYACYPVDAIVTNPPLGSRVQVDAIALLTDCASQFARQLGDRGRLVWITPASRKTSPALEAAGLRLVRRLAVDLGGVRGHVERWDKPAS